MYFFHAMRTGQIVMVTLMELYPCQKVPTANMENPRLWEETVMHRFKYTEVSNIFLGVIRGKVVECHVIEVGNCVGVS